MKDMIGQEINVGDLFLIPGGNQRFGGLVIEVGMVFSKTEKMLKTYVTRFDKIKLKPTNKTPRKVLKVSNPSRILLANSSVKELVKEFNKHLEHNKNEK